MTTSTTAGNYDPVFLKDCLARYMLANWSLEKRRAYLKKLPPDRRADMQDRLQAAFQERTQGRKSNAHVSYQNKYS